MLIVFISLFYERFFCRYLCPLGAFYSLLNKLSLFKIKINTTSCINCNKCSSICPAHIEVLKNEVISSKECYSCFACIENCPVEEKAIDVKILKNKFSYKKIILIALIFFFASIILSYQIGFLQTMPNQISKILNNNPNNIRGWMSIEVILKEFKLEKKEFYKEIGIGEEELPISTTIKESEKILEKKEIKFKHEEIGETIKKLKINETL